MISPLDDFALVFDNIAVPGARAAEPSPFDDPFAYGALSMAGADPLGALTAWEESIALAPAPPPGEPGFYLVDDCAGRFVVDRDFGVISLADGALLAREAGTIHAVRLRVVEASGESYEQLIRLKLTGLVPQLAGAEEESLIGETPLAQGPSPQVAWTRYAAIAAHGAPEPIAQPAAPFGAALPAPALQSARAEPAALALPAPPPAALAETAWTALSFC